MKLRIQWTDPQSDISIMAEWEDLLILTLKVRSQTTIIQQKVTWSIHKYIWENHTLRHLKTGILEQARETGWRNNRDKSYRCNLTFTAAPADSAVGKELYSNRHMAAQRAGGAGGAFWTQWPGLIVAKPSDKGRDAAQPLSGRERNHRCSYLPPCPSWPPLWQLGHLGEYRAADSLWLQVAVPGIHRPIAPSLATSHHWG